MNRQPKISVIIPMYNAEKYISECLNSVLVQTYKNLEIIVIDDGSTDDSIKIAENKGKNIKIIRQKNFGVSVARNSGFAVATGEWIHFVDADDKLSNIDFYEKMIEAITDPNIDIAAVGVVDEKHGSRPTYSYKRVRIYTRTQQKINATHVARRPAVWNYVFRRQMLSAHKMLFEPGRQISQDVMFSIMAIYYARAVVTVPGAFYWYRRTPTGAIRDPARAAARIEDKKVVWTRAARFAAEHRFWFGPRRAFWKWVKAMIPGK